ncbi:N-acetylglucosamine kinase [Spongiactinospora gelatinilytica]|uniref:N-acetylglucosamine kinase n=1 Tax=Spongiactinospora gelatinilytica TaxID=2666298 RepID=UPI001314EAC2|nr:BadF/BadG/BcrA/BcrD ATPase family protein [Spongiactinospora gelatinilytica]
MEGAADGAGEGVVLGLDVGGSNTRAVAAALDGSRLARGVSGPGNPSAHGVSVACAAMAAAAGEALDAYAREYGRPRVLGGVAGVSGIGPLLQGEGRAAFAGIWEALGTATPVTATHDVLVAFAAGTPEPDGHVLLAGTGAIAAAVGDRRMTAAADGLGWLFGDHGSAYWIGHQAAKRVVHAVAVQAPLGALADEITRAILGTGLDGAGRRQAARVIAAAQARPPIELARLAPLVSRAAEAGDELALEIVAEAARLLTGTVASVRPAGAHTPIVLAGSVLTSQGPVRRAVLALLRERWDAPVTVAADGAGAAAWLAALDVLGERDAPAHDTFTGRVFSGDTDIG